MPAQFTHARLVILFASLGLLFLAAGATAWRYFAVQTAPPAGSLILLPEPRIIADFALVNHHGEPFSLEQFKGHWSVLFFGFTACPDICPNTLYQLQQARKQMLEDGSPAEIPQIYLVSVDPERDTPKKLADYLSYFDPAFIGLTGDEAQLKALTMQLGIAYFIEPHDPGNLEYSVDHSASLLLLNRDAQLLGVLPAALDAADIARAIEAAVRRGGGGP
jgi:protein SCO1/2